MTGSAPQALGVELTCESYCKGRGVRGEGAGPSCLKLGLADFPGGSRSIVFILFSSLLGKIRISNASKV